jgi:hypothetical protein
MLRVDSFREQTDTRDDNATPIQCCDSFDFENRLNTINASNDIPPEQAGRKTRIVSNATFRTDATHLKARQYLLRYAKRKNSTIRLNNDKICGVDTTDEQAKSTILSQSNVASEGDVEEKNPTLTTTMDNPYGNAMTSHPQQQKTRYPQHLDFDNKSVASMPQSEPLSQLRSTGLILHDDMLQKYSYFYWDDDVRDGLDSESTVRGKQNGTLCLSASFKNITTTSRYQYPPSLDTCSVSSAPLPSKSFYYTKLPVPKKVHNMEGTGSKFFYNALPTPSASTSIHSLLLRKNSREAAQPMKPQVKIVYNEFFGKRSILSFHASDGTKLQLMEEPFASQSLCKNHVLVKVQVRG